MEKRLIELIRKQKYIFCTITVLLITVVSITLSRPSVKSKMEFKKYLKSTTLLESNVKTYFNSNEDNLSINELDSLLYLLDSSQKNLSKSYSLFASNCNNIQNIKLTALQGLSPGQFTLNKYNDKMNTLNFYFYVSTNTIKSNKLGKEIDNLQVISDEEFESFNK